jgi:hypothetical protein
MSKNVTKTKMIYHCTNTNMKGGGGIETYVASLALSQIPGVSDRVLQSIKGEDQTQFELLHIHDPEFLADLREECPAIFTLHNHSTYCPSGTKYLASSIL